MESHSQHEVQEGINRGLIIDALSFEGFSNDKIATEHPFKKKILIFHKGNNNWKYKPSYSEVIKDFSENKNVISFQDSKFPKCLPKGVNAHDSYHPPNSMVEVMILIYKW